MILRFANCELDVNRVIVRRDGREVKLEPQAFDVLCYLVEHRGEVVRKEQILDNVGGDRFVSESALTTRIKSVRQALGDDGSRQAIIRTVHGKGYEFHATVETLEAPASEDGGQVQLPQEPTLPAALQPLIGRESLLERLASALDKHRLITLVGPGGVGKTSVGVELTRRTAERYPDGVKLVELVAVGDEDATLEAVATSIDVHVRRGSSIGDTIIETLEATASTHRARQLRAPRRAGGVPRQPGPSGGTSHLHSGHLTRAARAARASRCGRSIRCRPAMQAPVPSPGAASRAPRPSRSSSSERVPPTRASSSTSKKREGRGRDLPAPRPRDPARDGARGGSRPDDRPSGDRRARLEQSGYVC